MKKIKSKHIAQLIITTADGEDIALYSRFTEQKLLRDFLRRAQKSLKKKKPFAYGRVFETHNKSYFTSPVVHIEVMYK